MEPACVRLTDPASGSFADILIGLGCNCFRWCVRRSGEVHDILWSHPAFASGQQRPAGSGIPVLFPFPGRLPGTRWRWRGTEYALPEGDRMGNAIHGLVLDQPWRVVEQQVDRVMAEWQASVDMAPGRWSWPADARLRLTYSLQAHSLQLRAAITNPDDGPLPWAVGFHPYFHLPRGSTAGTWLQLPAQRQFTLERMLPTGHAARSKRAQAVASGMTLAEPLDDVFATTAPGHPDRGWQAVLRPAGAPWELVLRAGSGLPYCVLFTPPHGEAVCIEPYSCVPGAAGLEGRAAELGWQVLPPGQSVAVDLHLEVQGI